MEGRRRIDFITRQAEPFNLSLQVSEGLVPTKAGKIPCEPLLIGRMGSPLIGRNTLPGPLASMTDQQSGVNKDTDLLSYRPRISIPSWARNPGNFLRGHWMRFSGIHFAQVLFLFQLDRLLEEVVV
jgi:hypothetical protein